MLNIAGPSGVERDHTDPETEIICCHTNSSNVVSYTDLSIYLAPFLPHGVATVLNYAYQYSDETNGIRRWLIEPWMKILKHLTLLMISLALLSNVC